MTRSRLYQLFKYTVYALLTLNIYLFFVDEWAAAPHRFSDGIVLADIIIGFAATIDTAAWVVLLLMFELETYALADRHFTPRVTFSLHGLRAVCYGFILYALYGYATKLIFLLGIAPAPGVNNLCSLIAEQWAYAVDFEEYVAITESNCTAFTTSTTFFGFPDMKAVVDQAGRTDIIRLAWIDVINAAVWILVVIVLEIDVRLQERGSLTGIAQRVSNASKYVLYSLLFLAAVYWGIKGDFVDFWDAFLWLVAFIFIEMNVVEWQQESAAEAVAAATS